MSRGVPSEPEPAHRVWLHALEADSRVPDYAMQVARVYADFAAKAPHAPVWVGWQRLQECTHQREERLSQSLTWLRDNGWLKALPNKNGQRKRHMLDIPVASSASGSASASRSGSASASRSGSASASRSGSASASGSGNVLTQGRENGAPRAPRAGGAGGDGAEQDKTLPPLTVPPCPYCGDPFTTPERFAAMSDAERQEAYAGEYTCIKDECIDADFHCMQCGAELDDEHGRLCRDCESKAAEQ